MTQTATVETLPKGEYVKRNAETTKVYIRGDYDREAKRYALRDTEDICREIYVKRGTKLFYGFTY